MYQLRTRDWDETFGRPHADAHILETGSQSYRLHTSKSAARYKRQSSTLLLAVATALSVLLDNLTCDLNVEGIHRLAAAGLSAQNDEA